MSLVSTNISIVWSHSNSELNGLKLIYLGLSLLLVFLWVQFILLYSSRVLGPFVGGILTQIVNHSGVVGVITLESFSLNLISGTVMFRNANYVSDDFSVRCDYGCIVFSYWIPLSYADLDFTSGGKSRLYIWLSGIDAHLYNSSKFCQKMAQSNTEQRGTSSLMSENGSRTVSQRNVNDLKKQDVFCNMLWSLVNNVQIVLSSVMIIVGNHLLPTVLLAQMESSQSHVSWRRSERNAPLRLLHHTNARDVEISFLKCKEFSMSKAYRLNARSGPPPRTMGQGFSLLHCSSLKLQSEQTVLGIFEMDEAPSSAPHCNIFIDLGSDVEIAYGPWADAQRLILMEFFHPIDYRIAEVTKLPKRGERQILKQVNLVITAKENAHIDLWFMRDDDLNVVLMTAKRRTSVEISLPLTTSQSGSNVSLRCVFEGFICSTSLTLRKLFESDVINADITAQFPRVYNGIQNWTISLRFWRTSAWFIWDQTTFFMDLLNEISSEAVNDIFAFVPTIWKFNIECSDFEIIFILNDKNWIDASSPGENLLASVVGSNMHTTLDIANDHFCKQRSHIWASIEAHNSLAGRFRLPDKSTMSPALQSLHKDAYFAGYAPSVDLPANTELPSGWIDFWRTESVTVTIGLMYHPFYQIQKSDLPESAIPSQFAAKPSHPFMLEEDTLDITVLIGGSEVFVSGYGLWFAKNFVDNYFGMYNKVSDIDSYKAHTRLSRRMFGDVREAIELYRPLGLKMCIRVQNVRAHCLIHSVQTDGPVPDYCPVIYVEQSVLEVVRNLREMKIQVCTFGGAMFFERSRSFPSATEGFLTVDSLSFRGHALLSEDGISWDAGAIEYAWIVEVIIGNIVGKLHPTQAVMLFQFLETVHVMTNATDEELLVSERYDLCQHLNDIRTCSHSNLRLTDAAFRTQNCESADKLEYKLIRGGIDSVSLCLIEEQYAAELAIAPTRASVCNCHESSFCSSILLGILNVRVRLFARAPNEIAHSSGNWLECAKFYFEDTELEVQLPYAKEEEHLLRERKRFLSKHDRLTTRLYFLWMHNKKCGCYGYMAFFGEEDLSGCVFMSDFTQRLAVPKTDNEFPMQPGYMQSIIYRCRSSLVDTEADFYKSIDVTVDIGSSDIVDRSCPHDRFGAHLDCSELMRRSILFCPPLMKSYCSLLAAFTFDIPHVDVPAFGVHGAINEWAINVAPIITKRRGGVNELELRQRNAGKSAEASAAASPPLQEKLDPAWGSNSSVLYVKGKTCTLAKMFVTPLGLEAIEKLCGHASVALTALHPSFIVQRIYAGCAAVRHLQPLTATVLSEFKSICCSLE